MHRTRYSVKCFFLPLRLPSLPLKRVCMSQHVRIYKVVRVIDGPVLLPCLGEAVVGLPAIGVDGQPKGDPFPNNCKESGPAPTLLFIRIILQSSHYTMLNISQVSVLLLIIALTCRK